MNYYPDPYDMIGGMTIFFTLAIVFTILYFVVAIILCVWVYNDAKKRDMNAAVWLLIVLLTGCIGCIIYLIVRD